MQKNISSTIFYSLIFAMGGAPTIAMLIIQAQTNDLNIINNALLGLSVMVACVLVPIILIQNAFLLIKRNDQHLEQKIIRIEKHIFDAECNLSHILVGDSIFVIFHLHN